MHHLVKNGASGLVVREWVLAGSLLKLGNNIRKGDNIDYLEFIDKLFATLNKEPSSYIPGTLQEKIDYVMPIFKAIHSIKHKEEKVSKPRIPVVCYETGET